jgi:beta-carotene 3-hydroxylase
MMPAPMHSLLDFGLFSLGLIGMEGVAWSTHKYVMHGWLWSLHRSHHRPRRGAFELNDLFAVVFAAPSMLLIWAGSSFWPPALWIGLGMAAYGAVYALFHDGVVHRRFPLPIPARRFKRLVQAHRLHHAVSEKDGAVSFGFLWAPPVRELKRRLADLRS